MKLSNTYHNSALRIQIILLWMILVGGFSVNGQTTAANLISECQSKISRSGGITASFSMSTDGQTVNGTLKSSGSKFVIDTPSSSTWYDGKTMWTYNPRSKETSVFIPTQTELTEANPLLLISSRLSQFSASYAKNQSSGNKTVLLTPKTKATGMKSIHVTISDKTKLPLKMVAVPSSGRAITINLSSVKTGQSHPAAAFTYPKNRFPGVELVDLR